MNTFISSLCSSLTINNLWGIVGSVVPFLAISILFGLGNYLIDQILYQISIVDSWEYDSYLEHKGK